MKIIKIALISSLSTLSFAQNVDNNVTNIESNTTKTTTSFSYTQLIQKDIEAGKKYLDENNINLAIAAFERVLIYDPNNDEAKFYLAKIFEKQNNIPLAKKYFEDVKQPTPQMQKEISAFMKKHKQKKLKFNIALKAGAEVDTNINNNSDADKWDIIENGQTKTIYNQADKKIALSGYVLASISPIYSLKENDIINTFTVYSKKVIDHSDKDITVLNYTPAITNTYTNKLNTFYLKHYFSYSYVRYAHQSYLNKFALNEKIKFNFLKDHTNETKISLFLNKYIQDHDENYYGVSLDSTVTKHLLKNLDLGIGIGAEKTIQEKSDAQNVEYNLYKSNFFTNIKAFKKTIKLDLNYDLKLYNDTNTYFQKKQIDRKIDCKFSIVSKAKNKLFDYETSIEYINNNSNLEPYSYHKWILGFNIIKTFKGL